MTEELIPTWCESRSFAFIDFNSPKEATYALAVRANRFFRGSRKLNLQVSLRPVSQVYLESTR
jgi:hypothetical protein